MQCDDCIKTCGDDEQICYVIDNNGYIILSEDNSTDSGRFFGEVERAVMEVLVDKNVFKKLAIYDLQGLCVEVTEVGGSESSAMDLLTVSAVKVEMTQVLTFLQNLIFQFSPSKAIQSFALSFQMDDCGSFH